MTKPIPDKAEVALEYPDKLYIGTFERSSRFDAHAPPVRTIGFTASKNRR